ncbi:MAG: hypothetical protein FWC23_01400 [Chitinispirillia bacterium]|nr:hypothetical protein [Chitinispirillia bacterium]MCL2267832.1 hypothetical protein [Chitinispirillia bacterium]
MPSVIEYPPLLTGGFCDIAESDFERLFVVPFNSTTRNGLCAKFREWLAAIKAIPISLEVWIDGSFVTYKPDPADVDVLCILDEVGVNKLSDAEFEQLKRLLKRPVIMAEYGCHVFVIPRGDTGRYDYWLNSFGRSNNGSPKGIFRIFIGAGI